VAVAEAVSIGYEQEQDKSLYRLTKVLRSIFAKKKIITILGKLI